MIQSVVYTSAGTSVAVTTDDGLTWSTDIDLPQDSDIRVALHAWIDAGGVIAPFVPPPPIVPDRATKLGIKRALAEMGQWDTVKAALASDPNLQEDWDLAIEVRRKDPLTVGMIAALGLTEQQVDALIIRAVEIVA